MGAFSVDTFDVAKFDGILARGLSQGLGKRGEQVCIEAAICETLGLPHGDNPKCVAESVRVFKIALNDANWLSPEARAFWLRDIGLAQLGSLGVVDDVEFSVLITEKTIRVLIPKLFREVFQGNSSLLGAAEKCEKEGSAMAAKGAAEVAARMMPESAAWREILFAATEAADAASSAASRAEEAGRLRQRYRTELTWGQASWAATCAAWIPQRAEAASGWYLYQIHKIRLVPDAYLRLSANLALDILCDLNSPGCALLNRQSVPECTR